jgi:hypothetical protein
LFAYSAVLQFSPVTQQWPAGSAYVLRSGGSRYAPSTGTIWGRLLCGFESSRAIQQETASGRWRAVQETAFWQQRCTIRMSCFYKLNTYYNICPLIFRFNHCQIEINARVVLS